MIAEVGGTVGDIESLPFLEAIRQMRKDAGRGNVLYIHVTLLPKVGATGELKTKPTQHSVKELRSIGINPDIIICRSDYLVPDEVKEKVALFGDVEERAVIPLTTVDSIYEVPLVLEEAGLGEYIVEALQLPALPVDLTMWRGLVERNRQPRPTVRVALVGKYVGLKDSYISIAEALQHAALAQDLAVEIDWVNSEELGGARPGTVLPQCLRHRRRARLRAARHRGQGDRRPLRPRAQHPLLRHLLRHADGGGRDGAASRRASTTRTAWRSTRRRRIRSST